MLIRYTFTKTAAESGRKMDVMPGGRATRREAPLKSLNGGGLMGIERGGTLQSCLEGKLTRKR